MAVFSLKFLRADILPNSLSNFGNKYECQISLSECEWSDKKHKIYYSCVYFYLVSDDIYSRALALHGIPVCLTL